MDTDTDGNIYLGVWTNWSRGSAIMGATLTMTQSSGNILIAFTAIFIPFVASRLWKMLCFAFHTCSSKKGPQDAIYHQRQVILRNSPTPDSGLLSLLVLMWTWRRILSKALVRLSALLIFAILFIVGFTVAGGYSSQITSAVGDEVLITGANCGLLGLSPEDSNYTTILADRSWMSTKLADAANYAQQCYSDQGANLFDCNKFVVRSLPTETSDSNYRCPFASDICRDNARNLRLDTGYIDSNDHLGLNAPQDRRFYWRKVLSCAPLRTDGYTTSAVHKNRTFVRYNYGGQSRPKGLTNFTFSVPDLVSQYAQIDSAIEGLNFRVGSHIAVSYNGSWIEWDSTFSPNRTLETADGDVVLIFLSANGVLFTKESKDAWYRATRIEATLNTTKVDEYGDAYLATEAASPLGCVQQYQWCNSEYTTPGGCGPLAGWLDATAGAYPLFNLTEDDYFVTKTPSSITERGGRIDWPAQMGDTNKFGIFDILRTFGAKALASQKLLSGSVQYGLAENQWQVDVANWWNITLAFQQARFVDAALGRSSVPAELQNMVAPPANDQERHQCRSQKVRSSGHASFSLFGLLFTYSLGALILLMSFALDPLMRCLQTRRKYREYQYLEWRTNGALQLHRLAQDELGYGEWSGCTDAVPVTRPGDRLAGLDIDDLEYPRLALHHEAVEAEAKPDAIVSRTETTGSESVSAGASENTAHHPDGEHAACEPQRTSGLEAISPARSEEGQRPEPQRVTILS